MDASSFSPGHGRDPELSQRFRRLSLAALRYLHARLDLLQIEWTQERDRLGLLVIYALLATFFGFAALQMAALFAIAWFWQTPWRMHVIGGTAVLFALCAAALVIAFRNLHANGARPLATSLAETGKDIAAVATTSHSTGNTGPA